MAAKGSAAVLQAAATRDQAAKLNIAMLCGLGYNGQQAKLLTWLQQPML
jgi:hypothetical protein